MKLYVIRHGESETNLKKVYSGWSQVRLTEKGERDAENVGELLRKVAFDQIYSSDLIRAVRTAEIALPGCTPIETPLLREYDVGSLAGKTVGAAVIQNRDFTPYGGENKEMLRARVLDFMKCVEDSNAATVAAFSHAGWLRMMLSVVLGVDVSNSVIQCSNCTVAILEYKDEHWMLHSWINP